VWGIPVICGPHTFNFHGITELLKQAGALQQVADTSQLSQALTSWLANPKTAQQTGQKGQQVVAENQGALERTYQLLVPLIKS
jgi:3-deoxy-D-manno-octulosonic-acid transferase